MTASGHTEQPLGARERARHAPGSVPARGSDVRRVVLRIPDLRPGGGTASRPIDRSDEFIVHGTHESLQGMHVPPTNESSHSTYAFHTAHTLQGMHTNPASDALPEAKAAEIQAHKSAIHRIEQEIKALNPLAKSFDYKRFNTWKKRVIALATVVHWIRNPAMILTGVALISAQLTALVVWLESGSRPVTTSTAAPFPKSSFAPLSVDPASLPIQTPVSAPLTAPRENVPTPATVVTPLNSAPPRMITSPTGSTPAPVVPMPISPPPVNRFQDTPRLGDPGDSLPWESGAPKLNVPEGSARTKPTSEPAAPSAANESLKTAKKSRFLGTIEPKPLESTP